MQGVTKQGDRAGKDDHGCLNGSGEAEPGQADEQRPPARGVGLESIVDLVRGVVRVSTEELGHLVFGLAPQTVVLVAIMTVRRMLVELTLVLLVRHLESI